MALHSHTEHSGHDENHDRGLQFDIATLMRRRHALKLLAGGALLTLVGCGDDDTAPKPTSPASAAPANATATGGAAAAQVTSPIPTTATPLSACTTVPAETAGPFPGNGSNGPNALAQSGVVRKDIRASFGSSTTVAKGIPLSVALTIVDTKNGCGPLAGAAVYIWQCDMAGNYSMYSRGAINENYLRGVQAADANGLVTFTSIFPAAYPGRWPHIHFEVYPTLASANSSGNKRATSQLALPDEICKLVFATTGYEQSARSHAQTPLTRDGVFSDGVSLQMATVTGSVANGYAASLLVGV